MVNQVKLHSAYNPQKEAERFCENITGNPKIILITEPGESYLVTPLRKKFPNTKIIAIRYTDTYFLDSDKLWDQVWRPADGNLTFFIINNVPEEFLAVSNFLSWKPAEHVWKETADFVWKNIASSLKIIQSLIATRNFFGKRWFKNITDNFLFAENIVDFNFTNIDSFFAASGPGLEIFLNKNKPPLKNYFITAASSAISILNSRNIKPDICISTDGGYWAAGHLKTIPNDIITAFPAEAKIPYHILKNNPCMFLDYGSKIEKYFFEKLKINTKKAKRNGSVSGTAAELLLDYTKGNIYTAGLDLCPSKGFAHSRPHESEKNQESSFSKLNPISNFAAVSNMDSRSLKTYAGWFSNLPSGKANRIFRIGDSGEKIPNIKIIEAENFIKAAKPYKADKSQTTVLPYKSKAEKKLIIYDFYCMLKQNIKNTGFFEKAKTCGIEKEISEFISFQDYIKFIKDAGTEEENKSREKLKTAILDFSENFLKRFKDD